MKTALFHIALALSACCGLASPARAAEPVMLPPIGLESAPNEGIIISVKDNQIRIQNAEGLHLEIYNVAGMKVASQRIETADKTVTANLTRGIYIVKVGKVARRINIL